MCSVCFVRHSLLTMSLTSNNPASPGWDIHFLVPFRLLCVMSSSYTKGIRSISGPCSERRLWTTWRMENLPGRTLPSEGVEPPTLEFLVVGLGVTVKAEEESQSSEWPLGVSLIHGRYDGPQPPSSPSIFPAHKLVTEILPQEIHLSGLRFLPALIYKYCQTFTLQCDWRFWKHIG